MTYRRNNDWILSLSPHCIHCGYSMARRSCGRSCDTCNAIKARAVSKVALSVNRGDLPRLDGTIACFRCKKRPAQSYDHRDYSKPLDVTPVCRSCNHALSHGKIPKRLYEDYVERYGRKSIGR